MLSSALIQFPFMWGKLLSLGKEDLTMEQGDVLRQQTGEKKWQMHFFCFPWKSKHPNQLFLLGRPLPVPQRSCSTSGSCSSPFLQQELLPQVTHLKMCHSIYFQKAKSSLRSLALVYPPSILGDSPSWENRTSTKESNGRERSGCQSTEPRIHKTAMYVVFQSLQAPGSSHPINLRHVCLQGI